MFNVTYSVSGLKELKEKIDYINKLLQMTKDSKFQKFIQEKCLNEVKSYAKSKLHGTSNAEYYEEYIESINIPSDRITNKGFEIVSNLTKYKEPSSHSGGYTFSISLAFEYGTGIVGMGSTDAPSDYRYNVNVHNNYVKIDDDYEEGWWIPKELASDSVTWGESKSGKSVVTRGYEALEIFRISGNNIQQKLPLWVKEYFNTKEV